MATKAEELIQALQREVTRILALLEGVQQQVEAADLQTLRERLRELEARLAILNAGQVLGQLATLQEQVAELKKWREESERRRWQLVVGVFLAVLTFSANLVVTFLRKPN